MVYGPVALVLACEPTEGHRVPASPRSDRGTPEVFVALSFQNPNSVQLAPLEVRQHPPGHLLHAGIERRARCVTSIVRIDLAYPSGLANMAGGPQVLRDVRVEERALGHA